MMAKKAREFERFTHPILSPERERVFWANVDMSKGEDPETCWPWKRTTLWNGAGMFALDGERNDLGRVESGKLVSAHRIAYILAHPELDLTTFSKFEKILQTCGNRECCRPEHLIRGRGGVKPLPEGERLISYGMHFRPASLQKLRDLATYGNSSKRRVIEELIDRKHSALVRGGKLVPGIGSGTD